MLLALVAGCGGGEREESPPALPAALASELATRSDAVAARLDAADPCGALAAAETLRQETLAAVRTRRVPPRYRPQLTAAVDSLAASIGCTVTPPAVPEATGEDDERDDDEDEDEGKKHKDGKGNGKGKGKKGGRG